MHSSGLLCIHIPIKAFLIAFVSIYNVRMSICDWVFDDHSCPRGLNLMLHLSRVFRLVCDRHMTRLRITYSKAESVLKDGAVLTQLNAIPSYKAVRRN